MTPKLLASSFALLLLACGGQAVPRPTPVAAIALDRPARSYAPEPTPTPDTVPVEPQQASTASAAQPPAPRSAPAPAPPTYRWRVIGPGVNVAIVGAVGGPCQGQRPPVPWGGAYWDSCHGAWLMAHPPFFGAMNGWGIGTAVSYWDGGGQERVYHIASNQVFSAGSNVAASYGEMTFQVCLYNTLGSPVRVLGAN
jgi:hypothetical protein